MRNADPPAGVSDGAPIETPGVEPAKPAPVTSEGSPFVGTYLKAGLAVWVVLTFLMMGFAMVQGRGSFGLGLGRSAALFLLLLSFGVYAVATALFVFRARDWIEAETRYPEEQRIYRSLASVAGEAGLPMPRVALDDDKVEINAYTYGLSTRAARVHVTKGFLNHVAPTDEELTAVLAHEMGHIHHGDCVISTLLQFPVWLMGRIRWLLYAARWIGVQVLRVAGEIATGLIGLFVVLGLIVLVIYLSMLIGILSAAIAIAMFALYAFEREREYLADRYAARVIGSEAPLQAALAKLEQAAERLRKEHQKRLAEAGEDEEIDLEVAAPEKTFSTAEFVTMAKGICPSFADSVTNGEVLQSHPMTTSRIYYLSYPSERGQALARLYSRIEAFAERAVGWALPTRVSEGTSPLVVGVAIGAAAGILLGAGPALLSHWMMYILLVDTVILAGAALGVFAQRQHWGGGHFLRQTLLAGYVASTVLLVVGTIFNCGLSFWYPVVFIVATPLLAVFGVLAAWGVQRFLPGAQGETGEEGGVR